MKKNTSTRRPLRDMRGYTSPRTQKGVQFLDGDPKATMRTRFAKVFSKIKVPAH